MVCQSERRRAPRVTMHCPVRYYYLPPSVVVPATQVIDLSVEGACLETPTPLIPGAAIAFQIVTEDRQVIDARARVVYTLPPSAKFFRAGVCFTYLSDRDRAVLERVLVCASGVLQS